MRKGGGAGVGAVEVISVCGWVRYLAVDDGSQFLEEDGGAALHLAHVGARGVLGLARLDDLRERERRERGGRDEREEREERERREISAPL
jgi:hypothetical protein